MPRHMLGQQAAGTHSPKNSHERGKLNIKKKTNVNYIGTLVPSEGEERSNGESLTKSQWFTQRLCFVQ